MLELVQHHPLITTKTIIYDCFNNQHSKRNTRNSNHLLQISPSGEAQACFFNSSFTTVTNITKFTHIRQPQCIVFTDKNDYYKILTCNSSSISIYRAKINSDRVFQHPFQQSSFPIKMQKNDEIVYVSDSILLNDQELFLAYSKNDDFYLISVNYKSLKYQVKFTKLVDQDATTSIFSWFKKTEKPHYDTVRLILINPLPGQSVLRAVSIRDNKIMTHLIKIDANIKKSTIQITFQHSEIQQFISNQNKIIDLVNISKITFEDHYQVSFIAVFLQIDTINLVRVTAVISHQQASFNSHFICNIDFAKGFSLMFVNFIYFMSWFDSSTNKYTLSSFDSTQFQKGDIQLKNKPLLEQHNEIHLSANQNSLFFITSNKIYQYSSNLPLASTTQINQRAIRSYRQKITKCLQVESYEDIISLLKNIYQKYNQIEDDLDQSFQSRICTFILIKVLQNEERPKLEQYLKNSHFDQQNQINLLDQACSYISIEQTKQLIDFIAKSNMNNYLIEDILNATVLEFNKNEEQKYFQEQQRQTLLFVFDHAIEYTLKMLTKTPLSNSQSRCQYELLINSIVFFKKITIDMIEPIVEVNQEFAKNTIINYQDKALFIYFFSKCIISPTNQTIKSAIQFNHQDLYQFIRNIENKSKQSNILPNFIKQLLVKCHREWRQLQKNSKNKCAYLAFMKQKISILVRGLQNYSEQVIPHLESTYPGLTLFFYLKKNRKNGSNKIQNMAQQCNCPETAYIMNLSVADYNRQYNRASIDTKRLCRQLQSDNLTAESLVQRLQTYKEIKVKFETWETWKNSNISLLAQIVKLEPKIQFIKDK